MQRTTRYECLVMTISLKSFLLTCLLAAAVVFCLGTEAQAQAIIYDVSPTVSWVNPGQVFDVEVRVATGPPNLDMAVVSVHLMYDPLVLQASPPITKHSAGTYIPDSILQLTGDYGQVDGLFEYQVVALSPTGSTDTTGIVARHPFRAVGVLGEKSTLLPVIVEMLDSGDDPILIASAVYAATVTLGDPPTPTPTPTPSPTPTETPTPTSTPTPIVFTSAPLAADPGSLLWHPHVLTSRERPARPTPAPPFRRESPTDGTRNPPPPGGRR